MTRDERTLVFITACTLALLALAVLCMTGCAAAPSVSPLREAIPAMTSTIATATAANEDAVGHVARAIPHADSVGHAELDGAQAAHSVVRTALRDQSAELTELTQRINTIETQIGKLQLAYDTLQARWYVRWGVWIERLFWWILVGWAAIGIVGVLLPLLCPGSIIATIGNQLMLLIPFANPISLIGSLLKPSVTAGGKATA